MPPEPQSLAGAVWTGLELLLPSVTHPGAVTLLLWLSALLFIVLLHRHNVLGYGSERDTGLAELFLLGTLSALPHDGALPLLWAVLTGVLFVETVSRVLLSYALKRGPVIAFEVGFGLGLLSVIHPAYVLFAPYLLYKFSRLRLLSSKHFSAFVMAFVAAWWLSVVLFAEPSVAGLWSFAVGRVSLLSGIAFPEGKTLLFLIGLLVILIAVSAKVYVLSPRSIARHKWVLVFQISVAWMAFALAVPYSDRLSFPVITLFFLSSILRHLIGVSGDREQAPGPVFLSALALGAGFIVWSLI
ncbi:MAG: hypothetical protein SOW44_02470 [Porphyromonas sp.]|nr:hypothetical protein [Bacteroidales bacterium]MDY3100194.1 hypothetical protein [Porphyromonas sp.]